MSQTEIYRIDGVPVFQNLVYPDARSARNCARGDLVLVQDERTGLIINRAFDPSLLNYDTNYQNEQGLSPFFQKHLQSVEGIIRKYFSGCSLIEVGCGKGRFLEQLHKNGFDVVGVDPAYEGGNPLVRKEYFSLSSDLRREAIILRHVLEHISDPFSFLQKIKEANGCTGKIYIEVPCFDWIQSNGSWVDLFYEHVNYFRLSDLKRMFGSVDEAGRMFGGQYLYVVADIASLRELKAEEAEPVSLTGTFSDGVAKWVDRLKTEPSKKVVWGGASKGVIFSLLMQREGVNLDFVVDINPAKQGRFLPVTGLEVWSPERLFARRDNSVNILVMNSNYLDEVKETTKYRYKYWKV